MVTRVGGECDLVPGDRVCGIVFDCFKSFARSDAQTLMKIPDELSFIDAAALPMTYTTAHHALVETGRLLKGERILIHAAAGGTGQAAVQMAKNIGAEIFVTVGSESKRNLLIDLYGITKDHIFYSRNTTFAEGVMRLTQNRGVDVVLNSLVVEGLSATWEYIASFGRFVEIGKRDMYSHSKLDMYHLAKNISFSAVDIFRMSRKRPGLVRKSLSAVMALVAEKKVCASQPLSTHSISQIEDAFRYMQSGKNVGKIVVDMKKDDQVLVRTPIFPLHVQSITIHLLSDGSQHAAKLLFRTKSNLRARWRLWGACPAHSSVDGQPRSKKSHSAFSVQPSHRCCCPST